jgi:prepilin signal peptidase PulO-like enzyme (type II secretory pathway)
VSDLEPKLVTAVGFLFGVGLGGALAAWMRGHSVAQGRRCARCGASLSPVAAAPTLSWFAVVPRCRSCAAAAPWLEAAVETAVVLLGLLGIFALPLPWTFFVPATAFVAFVLAVQRWG